jgi:ribosomal protein S6E (S10)
VRTPARAGRRSRSSVRQRALSPSITDVAAWWRSSRRCSRP